MTYGFWLKVRHSTLGEKIRSLIPDSIVNLGKHLPLAVLATIFFKFPAKDLVIVGVTGTDGKTTVAHLIYEILKAAGERVSLVSSVKAEIGGRHYESGFHVTTPHPWLLQKFLRKAADKGDKYVVLEVTSHGLDQYRVFGIPFKVGVLTNVTHEHLDYHKSYKSYLAAKLKLLKRAEVAVVNREDESFRSIINHQSSIINLITYGIKKGDITSHNFKFATPLPGDYNQYNCLAAIAAAKALGIKDQFIQTAVSEFKGVVGRFEPVETNREFKVVIDFAHTPNALENVLQAIRPMVKERLIHVFGSAGLRDKKKRPLMGEASSKYADIAILTEEDYRTEDVMKIIGEIERGITKKSKAPNIQNSKQATKLKVFKIADRQEAINKAIKLAKKGDLALLTGKGHERSLCRGKKEYPWSEHQAVKRALQDLNKKS